MGNYKYCKECFSLRGRASQPSPVLLAGEKLTFGFVPRRPLGTNSASIKDPCDPCGELPPSAAAWARAGGPPCRPMWLGTEKSWAEWLQWLLEGTFLAVVHWRRATGHSAAGQRARRSAGTCETLWGQAQMMQPFLPTLPLQQHAVTNAPAVINLQWPLSVATVLSWGNGSPGTGAPNLEVVSAYCRAMPEEVPASASHKKAAKIANILLFLEAQPVDGQGGQSWRPPPQL